MSNILLTQSTKMVAGIKINLYLSPASEHLVALLTKPSTFQPNASGEYGDVISLHNIYLLSFYT